MKGHIHKLIRNKRFFNIIKETKHEIKYSPERYSKLLITNINSNWLKSIGFKTYKYFPVFLNKKTNNLKEIPFGIISQNIQSYDVTILDHNVNEFAPKVKSQLKFNLVVPEQDVMQYFIQWQRYRKYWWSSITTTPSLFSVSDIKFGGKSADVNIIANFPWGQQTVETVAINPTGSIKNTSSICCMMDLETALFNLLLDGFTSTSKNAKSIVDEYLRLHRKIAPYKFSFAIEEASDNQSLKELATLLYQRLALNKISSWLPDFTIPVDAQLRENLQMGVAYTVVLTRPTLSNGIFHLLNSSTMLKEQIHIADFDSYAALVCGK